MDSFSDLLNSIVLLLALGVIYDSFNIQNIRNNHWRGLAVGILVGFIGIAVMLTPWQLKPGVFFDTRWVLISLCGLYFGLYPTLIAVLMTVSLRLFQGGAGMYVGSLVIISSGLIGLGWRYWINKYNRKLDFKSLYLFGLVVELDVLLCLLLMPAEMRFKIIYATAPTLLIIYPIGSALLGMLLKRQQDQRHYSQELLKHQELLARERSLLQGLIDSIPDLIFYKTTAGQYLGCNKAFEKFIGRREQDIIDKTDNELFEHDLASCFREQDRQVLDSQVPQTNEEWVTSFAGRKILLDTLKTPFCGAQGNIYGLVGISRDITERQKSQQQLLKSEMRFRQVFESMPKIAIQGYNKDREAIFWNEASELLYGYSAKQALGQKFEQLIIPKRSRAQVIEEINHRLAGNELGAASEVVLQNAKGQPVSVLSTRVMITGLNNQAEIYCIDFDLTAQKQAEERAVILSQALEQSPMSVVMTNTDSVIEYVNGTFEKTSGYCAEEAIGQLANILQSGNTAPNVYQSLWQEILAGNTWQGELESRKKNGELFWEQVHIAPVTDHNKNINHFLAVKHDITKQKEQERITLYQAHYDSLTGLANRFLSLDRLANLLADAKRNNQQVAVLFLDFDDFKKVNDTLGHQEGDQLLIEAANRLRDAVRESDIVGRLGGDEFIVIVHQDNDFSTLAVIAEKLLEQFRQPFILNGREFVSTVSIGIATYPDDGSTPTQLLRQADSAMYHSKHCGRNTYNFYTEQMNKDVARRVLIEEKLRVALANDELFLCYQPLVQLATQSVIGAEALLRWHNPILGVVPPDEFIPIAEQTGLIVEIGKFVMATAIAKVAHWRANFHQTFSVAINVSPRQFSEQSLFCDVHDLLDKYRLPPSSIELEITEGVLISGSTNIEAILNKLSESDISISMDDFGTGYSSLSYLRNYPFDTLKVDKSFIDGITSDTADFKLVSAAIAMGHGLNLQVIAEGVETREQLVMLSELGCDIGQGYLFGKPIVANEFEQQHLDRLE